MDILTDRMMNVKSVKAFALECSEKTRAGKFTRVGQEFLDEVETGLEVLVRTINGLQPVETTVEAPEDMTFVSGQFMKKMQVAVNAAVARMIQTKVRRHPTVGKTLVNTI